MFERLFEAAPDGVLVTNTQGRILLVNPAAGQMFGYSADELKGQSVEILVPARFRAAHVGHLAGYDANPRSRSIAAGLELYGLRKDGSEFPVDIMLSPVDGNEGRLTLCVLRDISRRKHAEQALRQTEARFSMLVEEVKDYAIFMLDTEGRIASWNKGAERMRGYHADEVIGHHFSMFFLPEDVEAGKPEEEMRMAAAEGRVETEGWRLRKDGSRFWADLVLTALKDDQGNLLGFVKIARDITERKRIG